MTDIITSYRVALKRQLLGALKAVFADPNFPDPDLRGRINPTLEFPMIEVHYPAVYLTYSEGPIQNVGVGYYGRDTDDNGDPITYLQRQFTGTLNFNILALTPYERDRVGDALVNILSFGRAVPAYEPFWNELHDGGYISLHVMTDTLTPGGEATNNVPWESEDERLYGSSYRVNVFGEFWSNTVTGQLMQISDVELYPYPEGSPAPW